MGTTKAPIPTFETEHGQVTLPSTPTVERPKPSPALFQGPLFKKTERPNPPPKVKHPTTNPASTSDLPDEEEDVTSPDVPTISTAGEPRKWIPGGDPAETALVIKKTTQTLLKGIRVGLLLKAKRALRMPTDDQLTQWSEALGQIATRHLPMQWISRDFTDLLDAGSAAAEYVSPASGPLAPPLSVVLAAAGIEDQEEG
jgi:hypothetical protein